MTLASITPPPLTVGHWIDGHELLSGNEPRMQIIDPGRGLVIGYALAGSEQEVDLAVAAAQAAQRSATWRNAAPSQRGRWLRRLGELIERDSDALARTLTQEVGKPLSQSRNEVAAAVRYCDFYSGWADKIDGRTIPQPKNALAYTQREPLGVIAHILPWNYPLDILMRGLAPCLAAGNAVVIKPAEATPLCAVHVARLTNEAGFPSGVVNVVTGRGCVVGAHLAGHPGIHGVAFCGSTRTGSGVMAAASAHPVPVISLELGGKSPLLVLQDGDVAAAARSAAGGAIYNAGQSCAAKTRLIVHRDRADDAISAFRAEVAAIRIGHGLLDLDMGPLISREQQRNVLAWIARGERDGARIVCGGSAPHDSGLEDGCFILPTLFDRVDNRMDIAQNEIFGPVVCLITYTDETEAIAIANATEYGLAAELWTADPGRAHAVAAMINASHITINSKGGMGIEVPFGGIGRSGYGREGGVEGLLQYTRVKSVWMRTSR